MSRVSTLTPTYLSKKSKWHLNVPASLSDTGKRKQEYFKTKREALDRANILKKLKQTHLEFAQKCNPELMQSAVECNELAQMYGYAGLREAFLEWSNSHEKKKSAITLDALLSLYEKDHEVNWSHKYLSNRWKPFRRMVSPLDQEVITVMNSDFWRQWLSQWREDKPLPQAPTIKIWLC